jgi:hypothetical protein
MKPLTEDTGGRIPHVLGVASMKFAVSSALLIINAQFVPDPGPHLVRCSFSKYPFILYVPAVMFAAASLLSCWFRRVRNGFFGFLRTWRHGVNVCCVSLFPYNGGLAEEDNGLYL